MKSIKRKVLPEVDKVSIINELDKGKKKAEVCGEFVLINSTMCSTWKNKEKFLSAFEQNDKIVESTGKPDKEDLDGPLLTWFKQQRTMNVLISSRMLMTKT